MPQVRYTIVGRTVNRQGRVDAQSADDKAERPIPLLSADIENTRAAASTRCDELSVQHREELDGACARAQQTQLAQLQVIQDLAREAREAREAGAEAAALMATVSKDNKRMAEALQGRLDPLQRRADGSRAGSTVASEAASLDRAYGSGRSEDSV